MVSGKSKPLNRLPRIAGVIARGGTTQQGTRGTEHAAIRPRPLTKPSAFICTSDPYNIVAPGLRLTLIYGLCLKISAASQFSESDKGTAQGSNTVSAPSAAGAAFSHPGGIMHIRQLARNAVFIAVMAIVTAGLSVGVAQATSAAPTSMAPVSSVAHSGKPLMPSWCPGEFCAIGQLGRYEGVVQEFGCAGDEVHYAVNGADVYLMVNNCSHAVYYYYTSGGDGCVNHNSAKGGSGRFSTIKYYYVATWANC